MWLPATTVTAPAAEPLTLAEAGEYIRVDSGDWDRQLEGWILAARSAVESATSTRLITQTVKLQASSFADLAALPIGPIAAVSNISYRDGAGEEQALAPDAFTTTIAGLVCAIAPAPGTSWPGTLRGAPDAVSVTAVAGYGDSGAAIPQTVRIALLQIVRGLMDGVDVDVSGWLVNDRLWL